MIDAITRHGKITSNFVYIISKLLAKQYLKSDPNYHNDLKYIKNFLGNLKGPLMKIGQIIATIPGVLPSEYSEYLLSLQSNAPHMGPYFVKKRMQMELGENWQKNFKKFDFNACNGASLGQVQKAVTKSGEDVACKLQYPNMESAVDIDLSYLKLIFKIYNQYNPKIDCNVLFAEIKNRLTEELDYENELLNIKAFDYIFKHHKNIANVPKGFGDLSTKKILTMEFLSGKSILDKNLKDKNKIAKNLFCSWYIPVFHFGIVHGDSHFGNYKITDDAKINLLDFGCVRRFSNDFIQSVIMLYKSLLHDDKKMNREAYINWGFKGLDNDMIDILNIWARFLYDPLLDDKKRLLHNDWQNGSKLLLKILSKLKTSRGLSIPKEFIFLDRATIGIGSAILKLGARHNWHKMFEKIINDKPESVIKDNIDNVNKIFAGIN